VAKPKPIHLGFEVGTGEPIAVPLKHTVVTGQTQESGKTTTLEALISRSGLRAVAFVTKRGETSFLDAPRVPPYFRERADWQFVHAVLEATMRQKLGVHRSFVIKVCQGAKTLADVQRNVQEKLPKARGFAEGIYTELDAYLEIVIPQLGTLPDVHEVTLRPGVNVMDLAEYSAELQALVIRSVLEWVYEREHDVITIIPEAWEFVPQGRSSPVRLAAEVLVRKGAARHNFVWIDSQDLAGVDKVLLRACTVWLLGVQREANEIKRTLQSIPAGIKKPKAEQLATLERGQFYACWGDRTVKTYVQPWWLDEHSARSYAAGKRSAASIELAHDTWLKGRQPAVQQPVQQKPRIRQKEAQVGQQQPSIDVNALGAAIAKNLGPLLGQAGAPAAIAAAPGPAVVNGAIDEEARYQRFRARLLEEGPALVKIATTRPELQVEVERRQIVLDGASLKGRVGRLIAQGFFKDSQTFSATRAELKRTGPDVNNKSLSNVFSEYVRLGFLTDEGNGYRAVEGMKARLVEVEP
jgi:hypothetical protein